MKQLIVFDLDGTLAESKSSLDEEMARLLTDLLGVVRVAVISGGAWPQFEKQLLTLLPHDHRLQALSLLPTCGTKYFSYDTTWEQLYSEDLTEAEKARIIDALHQAGSALEPPAQVWGAITEDRGSQVTFSALGQQAPLEAKVRWDPDFAKRTTMKAVLDELIPEFEVRLGGSTSVDITKRGIDKAYGIHKLRDILGVAIEEMVFIGDALFPGGNDYPAKQAGVTSIQVRDPEETKRVIETLLACLGGARR
ncbi:MAG TPA: HAD-IIB family hydrolase [Sporichthyaceae bacterium]|nr:HAD-IIB family hydrolase [Sporichthyaceae bacterium]